MATDSPSYPVSLLLGGRACLVVGGGPLALRKVHGLLAARAVLTVVAPTIDPAISALPVSLQRRRYRAGEAAGYVLVIAATGVAAVDRLVAADADVAHVFVNVADDPAACSMILPAIARFGPLSIAVSSDATSPALARWARDHIAADYGESLEYLATVIGEARATLRAAGGTSEGRDWNALIGALLDARASGGEPAGKQLAREWTDRWLAGR